MRVGRRGHLGGVAGLGWIDVAVHEVEEAGAVLLGGWAEGEVHGDSQHRALNARRSNLRGGGSSARSITDDGPSGTR